jgi:quinol monooxygenase YgiN
VAVIALLELRLKAGAPDGGLGVVHETLAATRAFPGCQDVTVLVDRADPAHVVVHETWESAEADAAYRAWRATPEGRSGLGSVLAGPPALTMFTVADGV